MTEPTLGDTPHSVRISSDGISGSVTIDGTDLSRGLRGYTLEQQVGQPPVLVLYKTPNADPVLFEGLAHVAVGDGQDAGEQLAAFLSGIDPAALERAALDSPDLDGSKHEVTRAMLQQLAAWAQGQS